MTASFDVCKSYRVSVPVSIISVYQFMIVLGPKPNPYILYKTNESISGVLGLIDLLGRVMFLHKIFSMANISINHYK